MRKNAFTLIELLVVIAIIAILAAILFPVFAQAKLAAKKTSALSNAKQLTLGILMYNNDNDGEFDVGCPSGWYYPPTTNKQEVGAWSWDVQPYIKNAGVFADPTDSPGKESWQTWFLSPNSGAIEVSFASNGFMRWDSSNQKWNVDGLMGMAQGESTNPAIYSGAWMGIDRRNETQITQSAATILFADRKGGDDIFGQGDMISGVNWWDYTGAGVIPSGQPVSVSGNPSPYYAPIGAGGGNWLVNQNGQNGALNTGYGNSTPLTFADGHAKSLAPVATNPDPVNLPQSNMWDSTR